MSVAQAAQTSRETSSNLQVCSSWPAPAKQLPEQRTRRIAVMGAKCCARALVRSNECSIECVL
jgi:hypothetical protein